MNFISIPVPASQSSVKSQEIPTGPVATGPVMGLPMIAPGQDPDDDQATIQPKLKAWADATPRRQHQWEIVHWYPGGETHLTPTESSWLQATQDNIFQWWTNKFIEHGLWSGGPLSLPTVTPNIDPVITTVVSATTGHNDAIPQGTCGSHYAVRSDLFATVGENPRSRDRTMAWAIRRDFTDYANVPSYPDQATAQAAGVQPWRSTIRVGGKLYLNSGVAGTLARIFYDPDLPQDPWWLADQWTKRDFEFATLSNAEASPAMPADSHVVIHRMGVYQNKTGADATFSRDTWTPTFTDPGFSMGCNHGNAIYNSAQISQIYESSNSGQVIPLANHEFGHSIGLGHSYYKPMGRLEDHATSPMPYGEIVKAYLSPLWLGEPLDPALTADPTWSVTDLSIGPANDGSPNPVLSGKVTSSNSALVPLLSATASVDRDVTPLDEYTDRAIPSVAIQSDGTFRIILKYQHSGYSVKLSNLEVRNMAGRKHSADISSLPAITWTSP